ncbi:hypothetical protein OUY22_00860 [Nonomuraea sp. MCN248]|uniref:Uncharacterized protein n=1 Tax=Nonomuraea corallina TaxID=2989783 RepID=A0ABT4S4V8_9ACTN|nr:hypothetical protein [Nonomuraea corallina]MDA0631950.1 hypothetical protein [Nonomuraea corallina]
MSPQRSSIKLSPLRQSLSIGWALIPLLTFGLGTIFVIGSAAARLERQKLWLATSGYFLYFVFVMILAPGANPPPEDQPRDTMAMSLYFVGMWAGGTVHAFLLRKEVFLPKARSAEKNDHGTSRRSLTDRSPAQAFTPEAGARTPRNVHHEPGEKESARTPWHKDAAKISLYAFLTTVVLGVMAFGRDLLDFTLQSPKAPVRDSMVVDSSPEVRPSPPVHFRGGLRVGREPKDLDRDPPERAGWSPQNDIARWSHPVVQMNRGALIAPWLRDGTPRFEDCREPARAEGVRRITLEHGGRYCIKTTEGRSAYFSVTEVSREGFAGNLIVWDEPT